MEHDLAVYLSSINTYPKRLAQSIGLEPAVLWWELFKKYGEQPFSFHDSWSSEFGIYDAKDSMAKLVVLKYLNQNGMFFSINLNTIIIQSQGATSIQPPPKPPFTDGEFGVLCNGFLSMLEKKGRKTSRRELYQKFSGRTLEESKAALKRCLDNEWVTLKFDFDGRPTGLQGDGGSGQKTTRSGTAPRYSGGGGANSEAQANIKPRIAGET